MAMKIDAGEKVRRGDVFQVDPTAIVMDDTRNKARSRPISDEAIADLADDIRANGQIQPIKARKLADNRIEVIAGFTRLKAVLKLHSEDPEWKVWVQVESGINDKEAFLINVRENVVRNDLTPMDRASIIRQLTRDFGWTLDAVAKFFGQGWSKSKVAETVKLLGLPEPLQDKVSSGMLAVTQALTLLTLGSEAEMVETAEQATDVVTGKVDGTKAKTVVRAKGQAVRRNASDLRAVLKDRDDSISVALVEFLAGKIDEITLAEILNSSV